MCKGATKNTIGLYSSSDHLTVSAQCARGHIAWPPKNTIGLLLLPVSLRLPFTQKTHIGLHNYIHAHEYKYSYTCRHIYAYTSMYMNVYVGTISPSGFRNPLPFL